MRKVSIQSVAKGFSDDVEAVKEYLSFCNKSFSEKELYLSNSYEYAIVALYKAFEKFMYKTIVGCINHDNTTVTDTYGVNFGKHTNDDMCEFIITKGGYFDFKDRDGLIKVLKQNIGETYGIVNIVKREDYIDALKRLCALRNYAAHTSQQAKEKAAQAYGLKRIATAGSHLKSQKRFDEIAGSLLKLSDEIKKACQ
ncbi:hypothetical protein [uncultured Oscillibacter sp.]|uniref:hypothetical protein n=1 Tax=uncultured Oscillibacter sp. TaxID=876091 RepID=UPI0025DF2C80|nr:hypothetical protein [uncultured Oscillibacter sp.]